MNGYITLNPREVEALVRNVDDGGEGFIRSVQLSRRDSLDNLLTDGTGILVVSIVTADGEQQRYAISSVGSTSVWGSPTMFGFMVDDLQAVEPDALTLREGIYVEVSPELDSMGFPRVTVYGDTREAIHAYVLANWGNEDPAWIADYVVARIRSVTA